MIVMKTLAAIVGVALASDLPSVGDVLSQARSAAAKAPSLVGAGLPVARTAACPVPSLDGATIEGRWFSSTKDVKWANGADLGTIEAGSKSATFKDTSGNVIAKSATQEMDEYTRYITVTGCNGEKIGEIIEATVDWNGSVAYTVRNANGVEIARTGKIEYWQNEYMIYGANGPLAKLSGDDEVINLMGAIDGRLVIMLSQANEEADGRERSRRRRENPPERGGGRDL